MSNNLSRRAFATTAAGIVFASATDVNAQEKEQPKPLPKGPTEAPFERDYPAPKFNPSWRNPQMNRLLIQDFVIYAHTELDMVKKLVDKEPALVLAFMNWGAGDWESGLGAAAHMGNRAMAEFLLEKGARIDIFCAAMLGMVDVVKTFLTFQPKLIEAKGPHGISLHMHAKMGGKDAEKVLEYLQSVKMVDLTPKKKEPPAKKEPEKK
jgi:hypothetical protein